LPWITDSGPAITTPFQSACSKIVWEARISLESVSAYFRSLGITHQKIPERVILLEEDFQRTSSGKIKKADLRARLRAEHAAPAE